jgi:CHAT domain-containing protein
MAPASPRLDLDRGARQVYMRGGHVDLSLLRHQAPLPETADELCAVAGSLKAEDGSVLLGAKASETTLKSLSERGELASYGIVHFATHGALAGEISKGSEPGLILNPPQATSDLDDGYLSASEIANLKLDAGWVILSACNTAAGGTENSEALSGLARSFFYAGARSMLASHWAVDSAATVKLVTGAISAMMASPGLGRAEAFQLAMISLIDKGAPGEAHPAYWAPFVVAGEGGR